MTSGRLATISRAMSPKRSNWPSAEYRSTIRFCPSTKPSLFRSSKYALYRPLLANASGGSLGWKMAFRFTPGDRVLVCAQAGQAKLSAAVAAVPAMNSRRLMSTP
jgi:hypothetical protein